MARTVLRDISKIPIEKIITLSDEELRELVREANEALAEAESLKDWIDGIMAIKNSIDNNDINNKEKCMEYAGGNYEQITDY